MPERLSLYEKSFVMNSPSVSVWPCMEDAELLEIVAELILHM